MIKWMIARGGSEQIGVGPWLALPLMHRSTRAYPTKSCTNQGAIMTFSTQDVIALSQARAHLAELAD